ncbi:AraC family transcriptional regulator [Lentisphaerota bacterium WC36G]|nr:AraC family transcriptional regulator [Lentisphaerae bacterium WC36]
MNESKLVDVCQQIMQGCCYDNVYFSSCCLPPFENAPIVSNPIIIIPVSGKIEVDYCSDGKYVTKTLDKNNILFVTSGSYFKVNYHVDSVVLKASFITSGEMYLCLRKIDKKSNEVATESQAYISKIRGLYYSLLDVLAEQTNTVVGYRKLMEAVMVYCAEVVATSQVGRSMKTEALFAGIKFYINVNYKEELNRQNIASEFAISENYLSRMFKNKGVNRLWDYLTELRIERAKLLLENYKLSVKDIASHCGFTGSSYFCKVFSQKMNCSPLEYRKQTQE